MPNLERRRFTVALCERQNEVLLVRRDVADGEGERWAVPTYESAGQRFGQLGEMLEAETGVAVEDYDGMRFFVQVLTPAEEPEEITFGIGLQVVLPDPLPAHVRWAPKDEAIAALASEPDVTQREPLICYLNGECVSEMAWAYRRKANGELDLLARLG